MNTRGVVVAGVMCAASLMLALAAAAGPAKGGGAAGFYLVQVGAFAKSDHARARCLVLAHKGYALTVTRDRDSRGADLFFCRSPRPLPRDRAASLRDQLHKNGAPEALMVAAPSVIANGRGHVESSPHARSKAPV